MGFLTDFAKETDHRPEILLGFGFVPKLEEKIGFINWLIQDPGNAAVAEEQAFVTTLANTEPEQRRTLMLDLYKRVIDGVADLGYPLSIHLEATYGNSAPAFETFARDAGLLVAHGLTAVADVGQLDGGSLGSAIRGERSRVYQARPTTAPATASDAKASHNAAP